MATGYTRQSAGSITDGATIQASHFNNEYNQLESAFNATTGHDHSGGAGLSQEIALSGGSIGITGTLAVGNGGIGATTLTDGGILLGSGTSAVTAMAVLADGSVVVGDGATDPVAITAFTSSTGLLIHERGGIEANISAIADGGMLVGTGAGTMAIRTSVLTGGAAGFLAHEVGGLEFDASAITTDQFLVGTSAGVIGIRTAGQVATSLALVIGTDTQAWDANLDQIAALAPTDNNFIVGNGSAWALETPSAVRTSLGLVIGTDVQAEDAGLTSIAGLTTLADRMIYTTASDVYAVTTFTSAGRNLIDDANTAAQRTTLGLVIGTDVQADLDVPSQAEAEAGTATTERVWTAQRVGQAVAALETTVAQATQSAIEAETNENTYAPPDLVKHNPGVAKAWLKFDKSGTVNASQNISSVTDTGAGNWNPNLTTPFSSADYAILLQIRINDGTSQDRIMQVSARTTSGFQVNSYIVAAENSDPATFDDMHAAAFGDQ